MDISDKQYRLEKDRHFFTIFIFPFKDFKRTRNGREIPLLPSELAEQFCHCEEGKVWEEIPFTVSDALEYNEWHYFYPFVRSMLFKEKPDTKDGIRYLRRKDYTETNKAELLAEFYASDNKIHRVRTNVNSVDLHLFDNQIGLLSITTECGNADYSNEEFLRYNDTVRRVYPPFLVKGKPEYVGGTSAAKTGSMLAYSVTLLAPTKAPIEERFPDLQLPREKLYLSCIIRKLLQPMNFNDGTAPRQGNYVYNSFTDDRMFIVSYYRNESLAAKLSALCCGEYAYESSDAWYAMIFVDGNDKDPTIKNERMKRELIRAHTYDRWAGKGSFFGMSRYSFVFLGKNGWFEQNILSTHMKSMYYQMALIVLFQRAMLIKFSEEIKELTKCFKGSDRLDHELRKRADILHGNFIKFTNEYLVHRSNTAGTGAGNVQSMDRPLKTQLLLC